ncbi:di-trans,poly-cis-decaprenylcistransferase [Mytilinidion resinicola]|uniref:ditrans,polycis-polyprenyl diphosphate synthase [(2E,6E)-farnesyldiphosphate specific] n=1 Tax=Mytilinidion resinicola TaxID=574789 RepID=A0A6A6YD52_9PEZI|nr:di-trans,poly-cis-decaprenylcistransferase [Mytilinidion resinicola]KAF2806640.1 di-trans,poly-cis-decaprenylcistransferase [Mytilinidion resinicola]
MTTHVDPRERRAFHHDTNENNQQLTAEEREKLLKPYLPEPPSDPASPAGSPERNARKAPKSVRKQKSIRSFLANQLHALVFLITHTIFSVWFRFRRAYHAVVHRIHALYHYHHRTPEYIRKDVAKLDRKPEHVSVILDLNESDDDQGNSGLEGLVHDVCEITAWTVSAGIPMLSVYEQSGILKNYMPQLHSAIMLTLGSYFGEDRKPILTLRAPLIQAFSPPATPPNGNSRPSSPDTPEPLRITVLLLSHTDGRDTMVDLTKTLADMAQKKTIDPEDITTDLINSELRDAVSGEPELLILFSPHVVLKGYPPWQVRLTEIYHVPDNVGVNYQVFLRALYNYAKVEMRFGR